MVVCPFCQVFSPPSATHCTQCRELVNIRTLVQVAEFTVPLSRRFLKSFGVNVVFEKQFRFLNFPLNVFVQAFKSAGDPGDGWSQDPFPAGLRRGQNIVRSRVLQSSESIRNVFPNAGYLVLPSDDISFFFPPMVLTHFRNSQKFTSTLVVKYSVGFVSAAGNLTLPDAFYESNSVTFLSNVVDILEWVVALQPQNTRVIEEQLLYFRQQLRLP